MHDHLQQLLVSAKFRIAALFHDADEDVRLASLAAEELIDQAIEASRNLTAELSPPVLREAGLVPALAWLAEWMEQKHGLTVTLQADESACPSSEDLRLLLFQSIRELLFNTVKHAGVKAAVVDVRRAGDQIRVAVSDKGAGFEPAQLRTRGGEAGGFGLLSIRERLDLLGGRIEIESAPGQGSRFILWAPLYRSPALHDASDGSDDSPGGLPGQA